MEALLSTLAFRKVPTIERVQKRKKREDSEPNETKRPKLLDDILSGKNPPSLVPSCTMNGITMNKEKAKSWTQVALPLAGRDKIDNVVHWERVGSTPAVPPADISLHRTFIVEYTGIIQVSL